MSTNELRKRLSAAEVGQFFNICVDAIIYAEQMEEEIEHRDEEIARLREALGVYAKKTNWQRNYDGAGHLNVLVVDTNGPYIALEALEGGNP